MARHISTTRLGGPLLDTAAILLAATTALAALATQTRREAGPRACAPAAATAPVAAPTAAPEPAPVPPDREAELRDMLLHD